MSDLHLLKNTEILDLFEIKISDFEGYFLFHGSKNLNKNLVFKGRTYLYIPAEITNLEYNSDGKQNRPTLSIANVNNYISNFIKDRNDLLGRRFYRKKVLTKDLDPINFGDATKNLLGIISFSDFISIDTFVIHKKNVEDKERVEFELANILDIDGLTAPTRKVYNDTCQFQYRGCGCNYGKIAGWPGPDVKFSNTTTQTSASFFVGAYASEGDLGVPIADENDKMFAGLGTATFSNGSTYGLTSMTYMGDYDPTVTYTKGAFVKIDQPIDYDFNERFINKTNEPPSRFFVLISDSAVGKDPFFYTKDWIEDKCSKKLNGCSLRFSKLKYLPFGSFPGTVSYDYRFPG